MPDHAAEPAVTPESRALRLIGLDWGTSSCLAPTPKRLGWRTVCAWERATTSLTRGVRL